MPHFLPAPSCLALDTEVSPFRSGTLRALLASCRTSLRALTITEAPELADLKLDAPALSELTLTNTFDDKVNMRCMELRYIKRTQ